MGWSRWALSCQVRFSLCWSGLRRFAPHLSILQFCVGYSSSHLDWFGLIWSFLSALLASSVVSVLVCPGWAQALRGWSGILCFCLVGRFGCVLVGLVWLCLCLLAGFSSLAWFDLSGTVQNSSSCPFDIIKRFSRPDCSRLQRPHQLQCLFC